MDDMSKNSELLVAAKQRTEEKNYWLDKLSGDLVKAGFPADLSLEENREELPGKARYDFTIPAETTALAFKLSGGSDLRLFVLLVSALTLLLQRYSSQNDIILGAPISRGEASGQLMNTLLLLRCRPDEAKTIKELIVKTGKTLFEAAEHQNYPLLLLPELLELSLPEEREDGSFPLLDTALLLENIHDPEDLAGVPLEMIFHFKKEEQTLAGSIYYNPLRFSEARVGQISGHLARVLQLALAGVDLAPDQIDMLSSSEREELVETLNRDSFRDLEDVRDITVVRAFEEQARRVPDFLALVDGSEEGQAYTYLQLNRKANQLAQVLRQKGVEPGSIVAVMGSRSAHMVAAMLAALKTGCAFLPVSSVNPPAVRGFILEESGASALLAPQSLAGPDDSAVQSFAQKDRGPVVAVDDPAWEAAEAENPDLEVRPGDLAYVLYTAGIGGEPAGVMVEHRALFYFIHSLYRRFGENFGVGDKCLNLTDTSLDLCVCELFLPLVYGSTAVVAPDETVFDPARLANVILDQSITFTFIPPGLLGDVAEALKPRRGDLQLDKLLLGGADIEAGIPETYRGLRQNMRICFSYGPAEAIISSTIYDVPQAKTSLFGDAFAPSEAAAQPGSGAPLPAGSPFGGARVLVLDERGRLCPRGATGQVWISGRLARGYLNRPGLTAGAFAPNPYNEGERMYGAGEGGYWDASGYLHLTGPLGGRITLRGYRIDPEEVRMRLLNHESLEEALVIAREQAGGEAYLCAYIIPAGGVDAPGSPQMVSYLSRHLPAYMIPQYFVPVERIPFTAGGKPDLRALPDPRGESRAKARFVAPENELQQTIADIWKTVLEKDTVGVEDNFFEIGGNSLGILKLKDRLRNQLGRDIPDIKFLEYPTIRDFHHYLESEILGLDDAEDPEAEDALDDAAERLRKRSQLVDEDDEE
jgi:amino acid adenylation domain-containing protein